MTSSNGGVTSSAVSEARRRSGTAPLRGPLLNLLLQQQQANHAYKLTGLLNQSLPTWHVARWTVAELLDGFEAEGIVASSSDGPRKVYFATATTARALDEWMRKAVSQPPIREELHAMIACSSRRHAPLLLSALDAYQKECSEMLSRSTAGGETNAGSWRSLTTNLVRAAADDQLNTKIAWAKAAQDRIRAQIAHR